MASTNIASGMHGVRKSVPRIAVRIVVGLVAGSLLFWATAIVGTAQVPGPFTTNPGVLLILAVLAALAVVGGWRLPVIGMSAGAVMLVMLVIVLFAMLQQVSWSSASQVLNPFEAVGYGAVSAYPAMLAGALIAASSLRITADRRAG
ncbi:hypothetical protein ACIPEQ_05330 [Curtobacterium sp. NPDC087080]|uniref:hypothetical protein n=1 Tax=Curtobacterium sp. NPDC087080 TaxID=3363965 RepID=UPI00381E8266